MLDNPFPPLKLMGGENEMGKKPNHFLVEYSELMHEWDYEKNNALGLDPSRLGACSHTKAWWRCSNGHSWYAMISNRTGHNRGCPYCSHQLVIPGETDLATLYPSLAENGILPRTPPSLLTICPARIKKCGGYVLKAMSGKQKLSLV